MANTMTNKVAHATGLYLEGIRDGNAKEALDKYTGDRYTQHSTGVADGKEGFLEFFLPFLKRNPVRDIQVVRTIEDGQYVFCHVYQSLNNGQARWVTADLFDTDENDKLIEHWDVIQEFVEPTASGRSMVDGPSEIEDLDQTEANRATVRAFADQVLIGGRADKAADYVSADQYHQHSPYIEDGLSGLLQQLDSGTATGNAMRYIKIHRLLAQGNFAVLYSHTRSAGAEHAVFDIFRLDDGKIVEHWDVQETIGPPETWNNSGKF